MVVIEHENLHKTLWGPAAPRGRSPRIDIAVYAQLVIYALLGACCAIEYEKPVAVRLAATAVGTLLYFRNTALFVRLMLLLSSLALYGDIVVPIKRLATTASDELSALPATKLVLNCIALWNNVRIGIAIFSSGALRSNSSRKPGPVMRRSPPVMRLQRKSKKAE